MSLHLVKLSVEYAVECEYCGFIGADFVSAGCGENVHELAEQLFRDEGWRVRKGKTICPTCAGAIQ